MAPLASPALDTWNRILLGFAILFGFGLILAALFAPAYNGVTATSGSSLSSSATLVQVNGYSVLGVVSVPVVLSLGVSVALMYHVRWLAWVLTAMAFAVVLLGAFSIGPFVLPVAVLLVIACTRAR